MEEQRNFGEFGIFSKFSCIHGYKKSIMNFNSFIKENENFLKIEKDLFLLTYKTEDWDVGDEIEHLSKSPDLLMYPIVDFEELDDYKRQENDWVEKQIKVHTHQKTRIYVLKKHTANIDNEAEFFFKLIKLNFFLRCFVKQFNRQKIVDKLNFSKGIILSNKNKFFYAEKPNLISAPKLYGEFFKWTERISRGKFFLSKSKDSLINSQILIHTKDREFKEFGDNGLNLAKSSKGLKNQSKLFKKCKNLFCNEFSVNEYCQKCLKDIETTETIICRLCGMEAEVRKNFYLFVGKDPPNRCESCLILFN